MADPTPHDLIRRLTQELRDTEAALGERVIGHRKSAIDLADEADAWLAEIGRAHV